MFVPLDTSHIDGGGNSSSSSSSSSPQLSNMDHERPRLTEPFVTTYMRNVLSDCHETRLKVYSFIFNALVLAAFLAVFGSGLYICRMNKLSPEEKARKHQKDQEYMLSKIRSFETAKAESWFDNYVAPVDRVRHQTVSF